MYEYFRMGPVALEDTDRWSTYPTVKDESVAVHTFEVAHMAFLLAVKTDGADPRKAATMALFHDLEESITGDIPRFAKRSTDELQNALEDAEDSAIQELTDELDNELRQEVRNIWAIAKDDGIEGDIVKCADIITAIHGAYKEYRLGNEALPKHADLAQGIEDAKEICYGISAAEDLLNEVLEAMEQPKMTPSSAELKTNGTDYELLYFRAEWCGPCEQQSPIIEDFREEYDNVKVQKVDIDEEPTTADEYGVSTLPTTIIHDGQEEIFRKAGVTPPNVLERAID
jgi:thioredoxin 1